MGGRMYKIKGWWPVHEWAPEGMGEISHIVYWGPFRLTWSVYY